MNKDAQAEKERTWQAYLELPYRSKSEYKALATGFDAGYDQAKRETATEVETDMEHQLILLAWEAGEISEGQAMKALGKPRVDLRMIRNRSVEMGIKAARKLGGKSDE